MNDVKKFQIVAKTLYGLEDVLADEIEDLGGESIKTGNRLVRYMGSKETLYKSNIYLRTALRILKPVLKTRISDQQEYYEKLKNLNWSRIFNIHQTFVIDSVINSKIFKNSHYASLRAKDAIVDHFREKYSNRPDVSKFPDILINIHLSNNDLTVSLDSSGDPLNKRGYRIKGGIAPVNEVLAAAIIKFSGWLPHQPLYDLMCGSGTLGIEAALIAKKIPPGLIRRKYSFMNWTDFDINLFKKIKDEISATDIKLNIQCSDVSAEAIELSKQNAGRAFVKNEIKFSVSSFDQVHPVRQKGIIILNPPYGERINGEGIMTFYEHIGSHLKNHFSGYSVWVISSNKKALDKIGLKPKARMKLFNGALECSLNHYELFDGKYKDYRKNRSDKNSE